VSAPERAPHPPGDPLERRVLMVDDEERIRRGLAANLRLRGFHCRTAADGESALRLLGTEPAAIVITDIRMPGHGGMWLLEQIRAVHPETAVILLTGFAEVELAARALRAGASDFLVKPVAMLDLMTAIGRATEKRRLVLENRAYQMELEDRVRVATAELRSTLHMVTQSYRATLEALCSALDAREQETAEHSVRVTRYALEIANGMGILGEAREHLERGALLHDIGKIGIPDAILLKPGPLNEKDWEVMRRHPLIGYEILSGIAFLRPASQIVLCHHEHWDGKGYPQGLSRDAIPLGARIFAVADALDAITSDRLYRPARSFAEALAEIERCAGSQFDPGVVAVLLNTGTRGAGTMDRPVPGRTGGDWSSP